MGSLSSDYLSRLLAEEIAAVSRARGMDAWIEQVNPTSDRWRVCFADGRSAVSLDQFKAACRAIWGVDDPGSFVEDHYRRLLDQ